MMRKTVEIADIKSALKAVKKRPSGVKKQTAAGLIGEVRAEVNRLSRLGYGREEIAELLVQSGAPFAATTLVTAISKRKKPRGSGVAKKSPAVQPVESVKKPPLDRRERVSRKAGRYLGSSSAFGEE